MKFVVSMYHGVSSFLLVATMLRTTTHALATTKLPVRTPAATSTLFVAQQQQQQQPPLAAVVPTQPLLPHQRRLGRTKTLPVRIAAAAIIAATMLGWKAYPEAAHATAVLTNAAKVKIERTSTSFVQQHENSKQQQQHAASSSSSSSSSTLRFMTGSGVILGTAAVGAGKVWERKKHGSSNDNVLLFQRNDEAIQAAEWQAEAALLAVHEATSRIGTAADFITPMSSGGSSSTIMVLETTAEQVVAEAAEQQQQQQQLVTVVTAPTKTTATSDDPTPPPLANGMSVSVRPTSADESISNEEHHLLEELTVNGNNGEDDEQPPPSEVVPTVLHKLILNGAHHHHHHPEEEEEAASKTTSSRVDLSAAKEKISQFFQNMKNKEDSSTSNLDQDSTAAAVTTGTRTKPIERAILPAPVTKTTVNSVHKTNPFSSRTTNINNSNKFQKARQQPKSPAEEARLQAKYAAIESLEERAFTILVDLGMVELTSSVVVPEWA
jgi:hypothetical protein